uniref:Uncharacterized protein n=1 Tax=Cacopsylla melanoneura TaxID=428564 RepID=A0A8D8UAT5_9HEMI
MGLRGRIVERVVVVVEHQILDIVNVKIKRHGVSDICFRFENVGGSWVERINFVHTLEILVLSAAVGTFNGIEHPSSCQSFGSDRRTGQITKGTAGILKSRYLEGILVGASRDTLHQNPVG